MATALQTKKERPSDGDARTIEFGFNEAEFRASLLLQLQPIIESTGVGKQLLTSLFQYLVSELKPDFGGLEVRISARVLSQRFVHPKLQDGQEQFLLDALERTYTDLFMDGENRPNRTTMISNRKYALLSTQVRSPKSNEICGGFTLSWCGKKNAELRVLFGKLKAATSVLESLWSDALTARATSTATKLASPKTEPVDSKVEATKSEEGKSEASKVEKPSTPSKTTSTSSANIAELVSPEHKALAKSSRFTSNHELAIMLANNLCNRFRCEQVVLAAIDADRVQVLAVSGGSNVKQNSPGVLDMQQALGECYDRGTTISYAVGIDSDLGAKFPLHRQWSLSTGGAFVCSVPLMSEEQIVGLAGLRREGGSPMTEVEIKSFQQAVVPYALSLRLIQKANQSLVAHARGELQRIISANKSRFRIALLSALSLLVLWVLFGSLVYQPLCEARVVPAQIRNFSTPFDARLEEVLVRPGQEVRKGEALVRFDTKLLSVELASADAQVRSFGVSMRQAMDEGDVDLAASFRAQGEAMEAQAELLREKIALATVVAPEDGVVLNCAVDKRQGSMLVVGEAILQFAAHGGWNVEIDVPDDIAALVEQGQVGEFASYSSPQNSVALKLIRVDEAGVPKAGRTIFKAEATLSSNEIDFRSGMTGIARIRTHQKPVWWVAFHGLIDTLRLKFWI